MSGHISGGTLSGGGDTIPQWAYALHNSGYCVLCGATQNRAQAEPNVVESLVDAIVEVAEPTTAPKRTRKASGYNKRYAKHFKSVAPKFRKKNGEWKKNGFRNASKAAHKLAGSGK